MIYVPMKHIRPGMVLAREAENGAGLLPLLAPGQQLTESLIGRLEKSNVPGLYVECRISDGIEVQDFIEPELKRQTITAIKGILDDYVRQSTVSHSALRSISNIAKNLVTYVLSKEEIFLNVIDVKDYDNYTYTHSMYVAMLSALIGLRMGCTRTMLTELATAGLLHDIGKLDISPAIVNKPDRLTPEEFEVMKTHPSNAVKRLAPCCQLNYKTLQGIQCHHERFDGTGYPKGLKGKDIPLYGRILALADVYDALTSQRTYREALFSGTAIEYMMGCADTHFDYDILQAFLKTVAPYPVGAVVKLSDGGVAAVLRNSTANILRPVVRILLPEAAAGRQADLGNDADYLNVTITGLLDDKTELPDSFFQ